MAYFRNISEQLRLEKAVSAKPAASVAGGGFAAPEAGTPAAAGAAADLYSLALVACALLGARVQGLDGGEPAVQVSLPLGVSFELEDDQALVAALERALRRDPRE